jgi:hypothetical protein
MSRYAIFPDEKSARAFVERIDTAYGFPNADARTYAEPIGCKDGTWSVKIKDWLCLPCASSKWTKPAALSACASIAAKDLKNVRPESMVADLAEPAEDMAESEAKEPNRGHS